MCDNIVVFKAVYPRTIFYLWLTNTKRVIHLEDDRVLWVEWRTDSTRDVTTTLIRHYLVQRCILQARNCGLAITVPRKQMYKVRLQQVTAIWHYFHL